MKKARQNGVVLIVVLWITVLLTVLLVAFTATIKVDREVAADVVLRVQARASAEAVLSYLVAVRQSGAYELSDMVGQVYELKLNTMLVRFRFIPENSFISLNSAALEDIETVLTAAGASDALAIANHIVKRREGGADMQTGELIPAQPWVSVVELSIVPGMTPEVYRNIQSWFTADSNNTTVNLQFAAASLVRALRGADAEQVLADRVGQPAAQSTFGFAEAGADIYRVQVELSSTKNKRKIEATAAFGGGELGYHIARWNEYNAHFLLE